MQWWPPKLKHLSWREFARRLYREMEADTVTDCAAQLAYYFLFSLFPFLFFLVTLVAYLPLGPGVVDTMMERIGHLMPGEALALLSDHLKSLVGETRPKLLTAGVLVTLWSASRGVDALRKSLNLAYDVAESRPWWKTQAISMLMTLAGTLLIPIAVAVFVLGGRLGEWIAYKLQIIDEFVLFWNLMRWPFTAMLIMFALALAYYLLPDVKQRFRYITPGSILGTLGWLLFTWAFTQYVEHFGRYNVTYGSIGGVVVLLLWLYITGLIFIVGGEINAILEHASSAGKMKGARQEGELPPVEPPILTPGSAKSAESARKTRLAFWRWRRRVAQGQPPEPTDVGPRGPLP